MKVHYKEMLATTPDIPKHPLLQVRRQKDCHQVCCIGYVPPTSTPGRMWMRSALKWVTSYTWWSMRTQRSRSVLLQVYDGCIIPTKIEPLLLFFTLITIIILSKIVMKSLMEKMHESSAMNDLI